MKANAAQDHTGGLPVVGAEENQIPFLHAEALGKSGLLGIGEELDDRRLPLAVLHLDEGEALGPGSLGEFGEFLDLARGDAGKALRINRLHHATGIKGRAEDLELGILEDVADILELHSEAGVGLVAAEAVHRIRVRHALEGHRDLDAARLAEDALEHRLDELEEIIRLHKRRLDVDLRELGLAVGAQILVTEAAGDLEVLVHAADHEHLLVLLGGLREGVEGTGMQAGGNKEVTGSLGRAFGKDRGLDLPKTLGVEHITDRLGDPVTQTEIGRHVGTTQVEEAVSETQILMANALIHREWRNLGAVEDRQRGHDHLDPTGRKLCVLRSLKTGYDLAGDGHHILRTERVGGGSGLSMKLGAEHDLGDAVAVAQIDEDHPSMVAAGGYPAAEGRLSADIGGAQGAAGAITVVHGKERCLS